VYVCMTGDLADLGKKPSYIRKIECHAHLAVVVNRVTEPVAFSVEVV
jgi:hypothetical protein